MRLTINIILSMLSYLFIMVGTIITYLKLSDIIYHLGMLPIVILITGIILIILGIYTNIIVRR